MMMMMLLYLCFSILNHWIQHSFIVFLDASPLFLRWERGY